MRCASDDLKVSGDEDGAHLEPPRCRASNRRAAGGIIDFDR